MQSNYLVVDVKSPIKSSCGNAMLGCGYHKVCWTDGPRFTVWGQPRMIYFTSDVEVHDWDNTSEWKANKMKAYHNKVNTMTQVNLPPMTNGGTIEKAGDLMVAKYNKAPHVNLTGAALVNMLSKDFTTCEVVFDGSEKHYTYKLPRPVISTVGSYVVVKVPDGSLKVVQVVAVHDEPNLKQGINYKWVVDVVNTAEYDYCLSVEAQLDKEIKEANRKVQEHDVLNKLLAHSDVGSMLHQLLEKHLR